jgi:hypothetical protein
MLFDSSKNLWDKVILFPQFFSSPTQQNLFWKWRGREVLRPRNFNLQSGWGENLLEAHKRQLGGKFRCVLSEARDPFSEQKRDALFKVSKGTFYRVANTCRGKKSFLLKRIPLRSVSARINFVLGNRKKSPVSKYNKHRGGETLNSSETFLMSSGSEEENCSWHFCTISNRVEGVNVK